MVGVPGRSKACNTCRKRRVKCDEDRPDCQRCTKGGFKCLGYERERIWRNASAVPMLEPARLNDENAVALSQRRGPNNQHLVSPPQEMSLVAFQENIFHYFMFSNHVWRSSGRIWLEQAAKGKLGLLSLNATQALSQANFGRSHHQLVIETRGIRLYGQCLRSLAGKLESIRLTPELIIPILVMLTHAGSQSDRIGAVFHLRGLARLLHLCGPTEFQQQPLLSAFETARAFMMVGSLIGKQRLFLEADHWRTGPWMRNISFKTPQSELLDILVWVPGILQEHASMETSNSLEHHAYRNLLETAQTHLITLYQWRWQWHIRSSHEICLETANQSPPPDIFSSTYRMHFGRFVLASEIMLYNAILMWLLALLFKMDPLGAAEHVEACATAAVPADTAEMRNTSFAPLRRPGAAVTLRDPALEICHAFEWVTRHHDCSNESTFLYLFPVGMTMTALQDDPASMAWIRALLDASPVTAQYAQGENQTGFGFYLSREALLAPDGLQAQEPWQLFSRQDMQQFRV